MKRSFVSSAIASVGTMLASFGLAAMMFLSISTRAQALTISVGTPTVVNNTTVDEMVQFQESADNRIHIFYTTKSATEFSIMLASNNAGGGYDLTVLSTGTITSNVAAPKYLNVVSSGSVAHVYYYDSSSNTIKYLIGTTALQTPKFILSGNKVIATGLSARASGTGFLLIYSSQSADGSLYSLEASSVTFGASEDTLGSFITVLSTSQGNIGSKGYFDSFLNSTNGRRGVVYYDANASALKLVYINAGAILEQTRETIDSGSISDVYVLDGSNITRILYTHSTVGVKYAVQRRNISACWYIQKIDDGTAKILDGTGLIVSYVKSSNNLWAAFGATGSFFDDFSENIVNTQLGKATLVAGLTSSKGGILSNPSDGRRPLGAFVHANGIASLNFLALSGTVQDSYGQALASVLVKPNITNGGTGAIDLLSTSISGSLTDVDNSGNYTVRVASGATMTVSASSTAWVFVHTASHSVVSVSTASIGSFAQSITLNFLGVSSPTFANSPSSAAAVANDIVTGAPFNGVRITTLSVAWGIGDINTTPTTSSFTFTSKNDHISQLFARGGNFRFAPSAADTASEDSEFISTGTVTEFSTNTAVASRHIQVTSFQTSIDNGVNVQNGVAQFRNLAVSTGTVLPLTYTVVYTTKTQAGHLMLGSKTNALLLTKFQANIVNQPNDGLSLSSIPVITSTGAQFVLISYSSNGPMFPRNTSGAGDSTVGQMFLSTTTDLGKAPSNIGGTISLSVAESSNSTIVRATGNVFGLRTPENDSTFGAAGWYVRISTQINGVWHSAISPSSVTFSTPSITTVYGQRGDSILVVSSATSVSFNINGTGLISGTSIWITTSSTFSSGLPSVFAQNAVVTAYSVYSATWAAVTFTPKNNAVASTGYYIYIGSGCVPGSGFSNSNTGIAVSTVVIESPGTSNLNIRVASAAISSIVLESDNASVLTSSVIANTRSYALKINGWGLLNGSTISIRAVDESSSTLNTGTLTVPGDASIGGREATVSVSFKGVQAGKHYNVFISSVFGGDYATGFAVAGSTVLLQGVASMASNGTISYSPNVIWVASAAISTITTPVITDIPNGTLFNSTANVTVAFTGRGFVVGSSITFAIAHANGNINFTTFTQTNNALADSTLVLNDGRTMLVTLPGTATASGIGTGLFGSVSTGVFTVTITTSIGDLAGLDANVVQSTGSLTLLASTVTSATPSNDTNIASISFATFTINGVGLMDGTTAELYVNSGAARIGSASLTVYAPARSSATVTFDLRSATNTGTYTMVIDKVHDTNAFKTERVRAIVNTVEISSIPIVNSITPTSNNNGSAKTVTVYGRGLSVGATVEAIFTGTSANEYDAGNTAASTATFVSNLTVIDSSGTTGTFSFPSGKMPGTWVLHVSTSLVGDLAYAGASKAIGYRTLVSTGSLAQFTVAESSAPNVPTGLTVLSAGVKEVTLRWISPGDDGTSKNLTAGAGFIIYYSSGANDRAQGCAPCYPVGALQGLTGSPLTNFATNYNFANTWAQFLPFGYRDSAISTNTGSITNSAPFNFSTSTTKGLVVSTFTKIIGTDTLNVNGTDGTSAITPGSTIQTTLTIDPGTDADFWFTVRAFDEVGNISTTTVEHSTAGARIKSAVTVTLKSGDPTIDPNKDNTVTYTVTEVTVGGVIVKEVTIDTPKGALDGSDKFLTPTVDSNPPADTPGVEGVGVALDIKLESGKTEFKKAITITIKIVESDIITKLSGKSISKVKLGFLNNDSKWVKIKESSLKSGGNVSGETTHLTKFRVVIAAPAANLSGTVVYPNPFRPTVAAQLAQGITFDLMPVDSTIQIYTLAGDLVKQLKADANGIVNWNAKNEDGKDVASGVYFALIKGGGDKKTLKIAVQR